MPGVEPKEQLTKVTVLLPKDTIDKLDVMATKALMGSRGRVVQSIVDSLWDSRFDIQQIQSALDFMQKQPQQVQQKPETFSGLLFVLMFPMGNIVRRINQYLGIGTSQAAPLKQDIVGQHEEAPGRS